MPAIPETIKMELNPRIGMLNIPNSGITIFIRESDLDYMVCISLINKVVRLGPRLEYKEVPNCLNMKTVINNTRVIAQDLKINQNRRKFFLFCLFILLAALAFA